MVEGRVGTIAYALLGAHVNTALGGLDRTLEAWKPPIVVILDHSDVWRRFRAQSPRTVMVGRLALPQEPDFNDPSLNPRRAALCYCDTVLPAAERMGTTYDFWQGVNEPVVQSSAAMSRLAEFEAERVRIMSTHGFRVVVGSFGVGNPPQLAWWQSFLPALEAAKQYEGALALHEYAWPVLDHESPWYLLRHRKVFGGDPVHHWGGFPSHLAAAPLLITECGLDGLIVGPQPQGWKAACGLDVARYLQQLSWYDGELQKDLYVVGAALYCCCVADDPNWASYNIWPEVAQALAREARPLYRPVRWPPIIMPPPAEDRIPPDAIVPSPLEGPALPDPIALAPSPPAPPADDRLDEVMQRLNRILALLEGRSRSQRERGHGG